MKEILNKNNSHYHTNSPLLTKRTGHYAWSRCSFSWSDLACNHPSCHRTCCSLSPSCCCNKGNRGVDCLNDNSWVGNCCNRIGCFDGSLDIYHFDAAGSLIHGYARQEVEPFSSLLAASCPWQSSQERHRLVGCLTLLKESNHLERVGRRHLVQVCKLELMHLGLAKKICSLFSCAVGTSII